MQVETRPPHQPLVHEARLVGLQVVQHQVHAEAGGWVLRALHGTPASLGATPAEIAPVARRSPHYKDGRFVNLESSSSGLPAAWVGC